MTLSFKVGVREDIFQTLDIVEQKICEIRDKVGKVESELTVEKISGVYRCKWCGELHKIEKACNERHPQKHVWELTGIREKLKINEPELSELNYPEIYNIDKAVTQRIERIDGELDKMNTIYDGSFNEILLADISKIQKLFVGIEKPMNELEKVKKKLDKKGAKGVELLNMIDFSKAKKNDFEYDDYGIMDIIQEEIGRKLRVGSNLGQHSPHSLFPKDDNNRYISEDKILWAILDPRPLVVMADLSKGLSVKFVKMKKLVALLKANGEVVKIDNPKK